MCCIFLTEEGYISYILSICRSTLCSFQFILKLCWKLFYDLSVTILNNVANIICESILLYKQISSMWIRLLLLMHCIYIYNSRTLNNTVFSISFIISKWQSSSRSSSLLFCVLSACNKYCFDTTMRVYNKC